MKISVLSSGSKGNSSIILSHKSNQSILIDQGISAKKLLERIDYIGADYKNLMGVVITHDHSDHIGGAGIISRKLKIPIYIHKENYYAKEDKFKNCEVFFIEDMGENKNSADSDFFIGDFKITPFTIPHDGTRNYAYNVSIDDKKISHLTDLGMITTVVKQKIKGSDLIVLESNHDFEMLKNGPYPWYLKQRVKSRHGHLSNENACTLMKEHECSKLKKVILAHLSETNNDPVLAYDLMDKTNCEISRKFDLLVAKQHEALELIEV